MFEIDYVYTTCGDTFSQVRDGKSYCLGYIKADIKCLKNGLVQVVYYDKTKDSSNKGEFNAMLILYPSAIVEIKYIKRFN